METLQKKLPGIVVALAVLLGVVLLWRYVIEPRTTFLDQWEGTIEDAYRIHDPKRRTAGDLHQSENALYQHFWRVVLPDGSKMDIEVPYRLWGQGGPGVAVTKKRMGRYPKPFRAAPETAPDAPPASSQPAGQVDAPQTKPESVQPSAPGAHDNAPS